MTKKVRLSCSPGTACITKTSLVLTLLRREQGATLAELIAATGWQPHTVRAALTGQRKKGHVLDKSIRDTVTCYRVEAACRHRHSLVRAALLRLKTKG